MVFFTVWVTYVELQTPSLQETIQSTTTRTIIDTVKITVD
jgi:hypothetical protein